MSLWRWPLLKFAEARLRVSTTFGIWAWPRRSTSGGRRGRTHSVAGCTARGGHDLGSLSWLGTAKGTLGGVLAAEVGSRWSVETANYLASLARTKAQAYPHVLQERVQRACSWRWSALLVCSAVIAFTASLQDRRPCPVSWIPPVNEGVCTMPCLSEEFLCWSSFPADWFLRPSFSSGPFHFYWKNGSETSEKTKLVKTQQILKPFQDPLTLRAPLLVSFF